MHPLLHSADEVLAVAREDDAARPPQGAEPDDAGDDRHPVVRRVRIEVGEVPPIPAGALVEPFDETGRRPRVPAILELVAEAGLVGEDMNERSVGPALPPGSGVGGQRASRGLGSPGTRAASRCPGPRTFNRHIGRAT